MGSWAWWYILMPFIGSSLALIFYFVIRGGLLSAGATADNISTFGIAAVSGLVGMFSRQAIDKLQDLAETLFKREKPVEREDKLSNPPPIITGVEPPTIAAGGATDISLTVNGGNFFFGGSVVRFAGADVPTTFVSDTQLTATIQASALADPGEAQVTVFNPPPGGGTSSAVTFIKGPPNK